MIDKLKQAEGEELSALLGEVLQPRKSRHWFVKSYTVINGKRYKRCRNCNKILPTETPAGPCGTDPIPLDDWNVAMKWRDWAVKEYGSTVYAIHFVDAILDYEPTPDITRPKVWICHAQPKHYLQAAARCKLNAEKSK